MNRNLLSLGRVAALLALGAPAILAQGTQTASATIDVVDEAGAPIAGALVRLSSPSLQGVRSGMTDAAGRFIARLLPPGAYQIDVTKDGFQAIKANRSIGIDQNFQPRFTMAKTAGATVVVVASASAAVDKSDVKTATNFLMDRVDTLPTGRTMEAVAFLTPGVTGGVGGRVQIRGAMTSGSLYLVDGQNVSDNAYNNRGVQLIADAIEETQIITGAISAEYGNVDGGVLNSITRSGGNTFTGQIRWDLSNPAWNAVQPYQSRASLENKLSEVKTYTLGGFIIKDRLWFFGSFFQTDSAGFGTISSNSLPGPGGAGSNYVTTVKEIRRTGKLTWSITSEHNLVVSFANSRNAQGNRNYSAGEINALDNQTNTSEYYNVALRSVWGTNFITEARFGEKKQMLSAGPKAQDISPIYNYDKGLFYNNGIFNANDGGDNRNNKTANLKGTLFFQGAGQHSFDFGLDYIKGISKARNEQTPTGYIIGSYGMDLTARTGYGADIWTFRSSLGEATNESIGLYVNDKWQFDKHLTFQLGVRFDKYTAKKENGSTSAGANGISPRLGVKYDVNGDSKWILGASVARYNGKVLDTIVNSVTNQGNPSETDYAYIGPAGPQPYSVLYTLSNYDISPGGVVYFNDPAVNVRMNSGMKAPTVDEIQLSGAYSFNNDTVGAGFVSLTAVTKTWKNLISYRVGNDGTVQDAYGQSYFLKVWDNDSLAERKYRGLEAQVEATKGKFHLAGNISWSRLEGNYEGEGTSTPGRGEALQNFTIVNGVRMYSNSVTAPYGFLAGHTPLSMRWTGDHTTANRFGNFVIGLAYSFTSGAHYSDTRTITRSQLNSALPSEFPSPATQYRDGKRGEFVLPGQAYLDLAITQEFEFFKVKSTPVKGFLKVVMTNFLNHQQIIGWNTSSNAATGAANAGLASPWVRGSAYGTSTSASNYGAARNITLSAGLRF